MLVHESLESYYRSNTSLMFGLRGEFELSLTLSDFDNMLVFERDVYLMLIEARMKDLKAQLGSK